MIESPLILLVDDFEDTRTMYSRMLSFQGFRVIEAADGEAAVEQAQTALPDLVVMDLGLPKIDGWEATRRLKADVRTHDIPILALTGYTRDESVRRAKAAGCDALFTKPCSPDTLVAKIREMLTSRAIS